MIPFPTVLDSTIMNTYRSCRQEFFLNYMLHLRKRSQSIHLIAGGAFAKGLEVARKAFYNDGKTESEAINMGLLALIKKYGTPDIIIDEVKTIDRMMGALVYYFDMYKLRTDPVQPLYINKKPAVEVTFSIPTDVPHPKTGDPILYCGRFDMIGQYQKCAFIIDEKTTKQLGPTYANQFRLRAQLLGYAYSARYNDVNIIGFIVRSVCIRKTGFDTREILGYTEPWKLDRWWDLTNRTIRRMIGDWRAEEWDLAMGDACNAYGGCQYLDICTSKVPSREHEKYAIVKWNPLARKEETVREDKFFPVYQG